MPTVHAVTKAEIAPKVLHVEGATAWLVAGAAVPLFRTETARLGAARVPIGAAKREPAGPSGAARGD